MKVLFITTSFPLPPHAGAKVALLETLGSIESLCELHLLVPTPDADAAPLAAALQARLSRTTVHYYQPQAALRSALDKYKTAALTTLPGRSYYAAFWMDKNLRQATLDLWQRHKFDVVHSEWLHPAIALKGLNLPVVVRTLDLHFAILRDRAEVEVAAHKKLRKAYWRWEAKRFRQFEVGLLNEALATITVSPEDEQALSREGVTNLVRIPPPVALPPLAPRPAQPDERCHALFLCMLHAYVNRESSFLFTDEIWPQVSAEARARVSVIFAGGQPDEGARRRAAECGIEIISSPSDAEARRLYAEADIFLSPIKTGTGIKTKTLEAMSNAKPIIGFPNSFRGVPAQNGRDAVIVETNEEFARQFERLIADAAWRRQIGTSARAFIATHFDPETLGRRLIDVYAEATSRRQSRRKASAR
ncbi:MAG TPA: glycosyltransferase family 4 protein [Pyrinomonadaceae bacterium]|jgi:glycosyltransferase involved in cell wall biosynthesis